MQWTQFPWTLQLTFSFLWLYVKLPSGQNIETILEKFLENNLTLSQLQTIFGRFGYLVEGLEQNSKLFPKFQQWLKKVWSFFLTFQKKSLEFGIKLIPFHRKENLEFQMYCIYEIPFKIFSDISAHWYEPLSIYKKIIQNNQHISMLSYHINPLEILSTAYWNPFHESLCGFFCDNKLFPIGKLEHFNYYLVELVFACLLLLPLSFYCSNVCKYVVTISSIQLNGFHSLVLVMLSHSVYYGAQKKRSLKYVPRNIENADSMLLVEKWKPFALYLWIIACFKSQNKNNNDPHPFLFFKNSLNAKISKISEQTTKWTIFQYRQMRAQFQWMKTCHLGMMRSIQNFNINTI